MDIRNKDKKWRNDESCMLKNAGSLSQSDVWIPPSGFEESLARALYVFERVCLFLVFLLLSIESIRAFQRVLWPSFHEISHYFYIRETLNR